MLIMPLRIKWDGQVCDVKRWIDCLPEIRVSNCADNIIWTLIITQVYLSRYKHVK